MADLLLVENERNLRILYRLELTYHGYSVRVADSLAGTIGEIDARIPDAVVLDLSLDDADPLETIREVARCLPRHVPIVVNSGYPAYRRAMPTDRPIIYLLKSSNMDELVRAVRAVVLPRAALRQRGNSSEDRASFAMP